MTNEEIFLRGVWKYIPDEEETEWIERCSKEEMSSKPLGDLGVILREMIDKGITPKTIARLMKINAFQTAFGIMYHLGDPDASYEGFAEDCERISWGLFTIDKETHLPIEPIGGLHESILSLDPSGRGMRPIIAQDASPDVV